MALSSRSSSPVGKVRLNTEWSPLISFETFVTSKLK